MKNLLSRILVLLLASLSLSVFIVLPASADRGLPVLTGERTARLPGLFRAEDRVAAIRAGGKPFGVRLFTNGVTVERLTDDPSPAKSAGLLPGDRIVAVDGVPIRTADELISRVRSSDGKPLALSVIRGSDESILSVTPTAGEDGVFRAGLSVRDNAAGIGTLTFVDDETCAFGGLGHGICDTGTGKPLPLSRGAVTEAEISGIERGAAGDPGELKGYLTGRKIGSLFRNCESGVFGKLASLPDGIGDAVPVARRNEVKNGSAVLRCTLDDGVTRDYSVELADVDPNNRTTKCFTVRVTDPALLEKTGGIVQGMSGSPILQNGKLVGAVTHVLVGDPTRGYGIFIENMMEKIPPELQ